MLRIAVIDGQGGGIGSLVVKALRESFGDAVDIIALGTNATATSAMMKARADKGASGENAICFNVGRVNLVIGPLSILMPNGMLGEVTPRIAEAIAISDSRKILLPLNQEKVGIVGIQKEPLPHLIEQLIRDLKATSIQEDQHV